MNKIIGVVPRPCMTEICNNPATHWLVWTEPGYFCEACAEYQLLIGKHMGYYVPQHTLRELEGAERYIPLYGQEELE